MNYKYMLNQTCLVSLSAVFNLKLEMRVQQIFAKTYPDYGYSMDLKLDFGIGVENLKGF